jgi:hypothetical protein
MLQRIEPTIENAFGVQRVKNEHYNRLGFWSQEEVARCIANPADKNMVHLHQDALRYPKNNRHNRSNLTPVYAGMFVANSLYAVMKAAPYKSRSGLLRTNEVGFNIQELVVSDPALHLIAISEALDFAIKEMHLSPKAKAMTETFDKFSERFPFAQAGFIIDELITYSYDFGAKRSVDVDRLLKPNLIRND